MASSANGTSLSMLPGSTPIQRLASGLVFTSTNAGICALTGHLFSLVTPGAAALFAVSTSLLGLGISSWAVGDLDKIKSMGDLADKVAKTIISFFAGGAVSLGLVNLADFAITAPSALILMGPILTTALGILALSIACIAASQLKNQGPDLLRCLKDLDLGNIEINC